MDRKSYIPRSFDHMDNIFFYITFYFLFCQLFVYEQYLSKVSPKCDYHLRSSSLFFANLFTMSILGLFMALAVRHWNRPTKINRNLASNSYDMYIAHYPIVIVLQFALFFIPGITGLIKFGVVSTLSIIFTYSVSQFLMKPFPRIAAASVFILLIIMFVLIRP